MIIAKIAVTAAQAANSLSIQLSGNGPYVRKCIILSFMRH